MAKTTNTKKKKTSQSNNGPWIVRRYASVRKRVNGLLDRRPHRSFRFTRRRDYKRSLKLPGYWLFTGFVWKTLWQNKKLFGSLIVVYVFIAIAVSGYATQETYSSASSLLQQSSGDLFKGNFGAAAGAGLTLVATLSNASSSNSITDGQKVIGGLAAFFCWLTVVWLLRNVLAGHHPKLRDGLYNSGSPVLATVAVGFIITLQLLPSAIALIIYSAAQSSGLLDSGVSSMLVWAGMLFLIILSVYWISSSLIALVIVTLPGMYPLRAIHAAGDLVIGRRLRVLYRLVWLAMVTVVTWLIVMIPIILLDNWIKKIAPVLTWLPLVPLTIIIMSSLTLVFTASYIYLLYRRIVDDDAAPA